MADKRSKGIHLSNWKVSLGTEEMALDITYHLPTMLYCVLSPDTLTTIHTWAHLALATHMKNGKDNDLQG